MRALSTFSLAKFCRSPVTTLCISLWLCVANSTALWEQDSSATGTNLREYGPFSLTKCLHKTSVTLSLPAHFTLGQSDRCPNSGLLPFNGLRCSGKQQKEVLLCYVGPLEGLFVRLQRQTNHNSIWLLSARPNECPSALLDWRPFTFDHLQCDVAPLTLKTIAVWCLPELSVTLWVYDRWGVGVRVEGQLQPRRPLSKLLLNKVIQHVREHRRKSQVQQTFAGSLSHTRSCSSLLASPLLCDVDSFFFVSNPLPPRHSSLYYLYLKFLICVIILLLFSLLTLLLSELWFFLNPPSLSTLGSSVPDIPFLVCPDGFSFFFIWGPLAFVWTRICPLLWL